MFRLIHRGFKSFVLFVKKAYRRAKVFVAEVIKHLKVILARYINPEIYRNNPVLFLTDLVPLLIKIFIRRGKLWVIGVLALFGFVKTRLDDSILPIIILICNLILFASFPQMALWFIADIVLAGVAISYGKQVNNTVGVN